MKIFFKTAVFLSFFLTVLNFSYVRGFERPNQIIIADKPYYTFEDTIRYAVLGFDQGYQDTTRKDIYYVELWNSDNQLLYRHIHRIRDHILYGSFTISRDQETGWKIIRAYPQNPIPNEQSVQVHLPILLIHSDIDEVEMQDNLQRGFARKGRTDAPIGGIELQVMLSPKIEAIRKEIQCTVELPEYLRQNKLIPLVASAYFEDFIPSMDYNFYNSAQYGFEHRYDGNGERSDNTLPEGLLLRGIYELPEEDKSKIFAMVTLSHLGINPGILYNYTNLKDEFSFDLSDIEGEVFAYLTVLDGNSEKIKILPDKVPELNLDYFVSERNEWLMPLMRYRENRKIQKIIHENYTPFNQLDTTQTITIYDTTRIYTLADRTYRLSDYIPFSDVRELIVEILPYVKIHEDNGNYHIYIVNNQNPDLDANSPLFIVNGIPTTDANFIASLDIDNIDIVEVLYSKEALYPFNWLGKGGILAIYTKTPVSVPNYILHAIKGIYPDQGEYQLDEAKDEFQLNTPQIEPVIFWNPQLKIDGSGNLTFNFRTGDQTGRLNVCLFGVGPNGEILFGKGMIQINTFVNSGSNNR